MKVTLHGKFLEAPLYPDFTPYVTDYRSRYPVGYLRHQAEKRVVGLIRYSIEEDGSVYKASDYLIE